MAATDGFTDADMGRIVAEQGLAGQTIVASKLYARGVNFYTGNPIAVMDSRSNPFWSRHPVPVLWQDDQIRAFFDDKPKVLCVIRPATCAASTRSSPAAAPRQSSATSSTG